MKKYFSWLFFVISLVLIGCSGGGGSSQNNNSAAAVQIGTLPNGSAVYISQNNLPVSTSQPAQSTIYLIGGSPNESYNLSFATSQQSSGLKSDSTNPYGIDVTTSPSPCVIGTVGSGASTQCQITIASSSSTYAGTYLITPTASPLTNGGGIYST